MDEFVNRDGGDTNLVSNYYELCNLEEQRRRGFTNVALFIDESGSMTSGTIQASVDRLNLDLSANGFQIVRGVQNSNEDYITPCLTTSV